MVLPLRGIIPPLVTPLADSSEVTLDCSALERLVEHVLAGGVHGLFLLGTTGEFTSLDRGVQEEIIHRVTKQTARRVPVLAGISGTAIRETLHLAEVATKAGADALVLAAPYYFKHSQPDLLAYVEHITGRISLPLVLYNIPSLTKSSYEPETVRRASELPGVIGLKDSTGDLNYLKQTLALFKDRPDFTILVGPEEMLLEAMGLGAHGGVTGGANLNPKLFVDLYNAISSGDAKNAAALQETVVKLGQALYTVGDSGSSYLRGIKAATALAGFGKADPAPPFSPFSAAELEDFSQRYRSLNGAC